MKPLLTVIAVALTIAPAQATSVVFRVDGKRILIAADNRNGEIDNACKIRKVGRTIVSFSGTVAHSRGRTDWDALGDAHTAMAKFGDNPGQLGTGWAATTGKNIATYAARIGPGSAMQELTSFRGNMVCEALFFGWAFGLPSSRFEGLTLNPDGHVTISGYDVPPSGGIERSLNDISQELIDCKTKRAKDTARRWTAASVKLPKSERVWRHLQFIIQETSKYDQSVSRDSDVIEVLPSGAAVWLSRSLCPEFPKAAPSPMPAHPSHR